MKRSTCSAAGCMLLLGALCSIASGYSMTQTRAVSFTSDGGGSKVMTVDTFDTEGKWELTNVIVELFHSGHFEAKVWNDDPVKSATVMARMIRAWNLTGPGIDAEDFPWWAYRLDTTDPVPLAPGQEYDFGQIGYDSILAGEFNLTDPVQLAMYESLGPGTLQFNVSPILMVNDLAFVGDAPDVWRMEVKNPDLTVTAKITYVYIPEPATLAMLLVTVPFLRRRTRCQ